MKKPIPLEVDGISCTVKIDQHWTNGLHIIIKNRMNGENISDTICPQAAHELAKYILENVKL